MSVSTLVLASVSGGIVHCIKQFEQMERAIASACVTYGWMGRYMNTHIYNAYTGAAICESENYRSCIVNVQI